VAKLQTKTWLSRALSSSFNSVVARSYRSILMKFGMVMHIGRSAAAILEMHKNRRISATV